MLLVEDHPLSREVAVELLKRVGIEVHVAEHGAQALEILARERFDAVLVDCQMPVLDGYGVVLGTTLRGTRFARVASVDDVLAREEDARLVEVDEAALVIEQHL